MKTIQRAGEKAEKKMGKPQYQVRGGVVLAGLVTLTLAMGAFVLHPASPWVIGMERAKAEEKVERKKRIEAFAEAVNQEIEQRLQERREEQERMRKAEHRFTDTSRMPLVFGNR